MLIYYYGVYLWLMALLDLVLWGVLVVDGLAGLVNDMLGLRRHKPRS